MKVYFMLVDKASSYTFFFGNFTSIAAAIFFPFYLEIASFNLRKIDSNSSLQQSDIQRKFIHGSIEIITIM